MSILVNYVMVGLSFGMLLFLMASGLSLVLGLMRTLNMAHGSFYLLAAYISAMVARETGNFILGVLAGVFSVTLLGFLMERFLLRRFYEQEFAQVMLTIGLVFIFGDVALWVFQGAIVLPPKPEVLAGSVSLFGGFVFPIYRLFVILIGVIAALGLWVFRERTRLGAIVRAGAEDPAMVRGLGINIYSIFTGVFALGAFYAALSGVIGSPFTAVYPGMDWQVLLFAIAVVIVGGLGSLRGALAGSLLIGVAHTFTKAYVPELAYFSFFGPMAIILIVKPSGLFVR